MDWVSRVKTEADKGIKAFSHKTFCLGAVSPGGFGGLRGLISVRHVLELGFTADVISEQILVPNGMNAFNEQNH